MAVMMLPSFLDDEDAIEQKVIQNESTKCVDQDWLKKKWTKIKNFIGIVHQDRVNLVAQLFLTVIAVECVLAHKWPSIKLYSSTHTHTIRVKQCTCSISDVENIEAAEQSYPFLYGIGCRSLTSWQYMLLNVLCYHFASCSICNME